MLDGDAVQPIGDVPLPDNGDIVLVVGPEGGITPDELAAFEGAGAVRVSVGPTVLRTSTAGTVAAAVVLPRTGRGREGPDRGRARSATRR